MLPRMWHLLALWLAGIGALNIGIGKFLGFDVLSVVPTGMFTTIVVLAIGISGGYQIWNLIKKKL